MISVQVRYFAAARERAGASSERVSVPPPHQVRQLIDVVCAAHPKLSALIPQLRIAVDQAFASMDTELRDGVEVAFIPPVAGGAGALCQVVDRALDVAEVIRAVAGAEQGGVVTFIGSVRNQTTGRAVTALEYEAYAPMAEKVLQAISAEAAQRWPGVQLAVMHRVGRLVPGEAAVVIATSAPHRADAFAACQHVIDRLKQDVPIWKKEFFADGEVWVGLGP